MSDDSDPGGDLGNVNLFSAAGSEEEPDMPEKGPEEPESATCTEEWQLMNDLYDTCGHIAKEFLTSWQMLADSAIRKMVRKIFMNQQKTGASQLQGPTKGATGFCSRFSKHGL